MLPEGDNNMTQKQRLHMGGIHPTSFMSAHSTTRTTPPTLAGSMLQQAGCRQLQRRFLKSTKAVSWAGDSLPQLLSCYLKGIAIQLVLVSEL